MPQGTAHSRQGSGLPQPHPVLQSTHPHRVRAPLDSGARKVTNGLLGNGGRILAWYILVSVYIYLFYLAGKKVNDALVNVKSKFDVARTIGGALMCLTVPLATYQIVLHLSNFVEPRQQSQIVRIVFMVPIYSVTAFLSLRFVHWSLFITTVRECYEAYVIYCFLHFLVGTLGDGVPAANSRLAAMPPVVGRHTPPFCCLEPWQMGREFLQRCQAGVFQYVLIRLASTAVALVLQLKHLYTEGDFDPKRGYLWITVVTCVSQSWALYVLVLFYRATHKELVHIHPMGKFLAIKTIVFFSWWQGILIECLEGRGHFNGVDGISSAEGHNSGDGSSEHVAQGIQDLLICLEMLVAAVFFFYAFPLSDYLREPDEQSRRPPTQLQQQNSGFHPHAEDDLGEGDVNPVRPEGKVKHKGVLGEGGLSMPYNKSHPRLDLINRSTVSSSQRTARQHRLPIWQALRQSACPVELRLDLRATGATVSAQRARFGERFAFLTKRKVEARRDGTHSASVALGMGRVLTL